MILPSFSKDKKRKEKLKIKIEKYFPLINKRLVIFFIIIIVFFKKKNNPIRAIQGTNTRTLAKLCVGLYWRDISIIFSDKKNVTDAARCRGICSIVDVFTKFHPSFIRAKLCKIRDRWNVIGCWDEVLWIIGFGGDGGATTSTSPRNAANLSRFLLVGATGRDVLLHWQADEDTCLLPASPSSSMVPHWHQ